MCARTAGHSISGGTSALGVIEAGEAARPPSKDINMKACDLMISVLFVFLCRSETRPRCLVSRSPSVAGMLRSPSPVTSDSLFLSRWTHVMLTSMICAEFYRLYLCFVQTVHSPICKALYAGGTWKRAGTSSLAFRVGALMLTSRSLAVNCADGVSMAVWCQYGVVRMCMFTIVKLVRALA